MRSSPTATRLTNPAYFGRTNGMAQWRRVSTSVQFTLSDTVLASVDCFGLARHGNSHALCRPNWTWAFSSVVEQLAYTKIRPRDPYSPHVVPLGQPAPKSMLPGNLPGPTCPHLPLNFLRRFGGTRVWVPPVRLRSPARAPDQPAAQLHGSCALGTRFDAELVESCWRLRGGVVDDLD